MTDPETLIIGGTNKSGTTSVFNYLSEHPQVCGSNVKETGFFLNDYTGEPARDRERFGGYFQHCDPAARVRVEASTGYLARAEIVVERIRQLLGSPKILFILRPPADRLYSYFNFHVARFSLPSSLSFDDYLRLSLESESGIHDDRDPSFDPHHLQVLHQGNYSVYLERYIAVFGKAPIKVMLFEDLGASPRSFMQALSRFAGIDPAFYQDYEFEKANTTFSSRNDTIHRLALFTSRKLERFLRQRHSLNRFLVTSYRRLNTSKEGYDAMSSWARRTLYDYYAPDANRLESLIGSSLPESWRNGG